LKQYVSNTIDEINSSSNKEEAKRKLNELKNEIEKLNTIYITSSESLVGIIELIKQNKELYMENNKELETKYSKHTEYKRFIAKFDELLDLYNNKFLMLDIVGDRENFYLMYKDSLTDKWENIKYGRYSIPHTPIGKPVLSARSARGGNTNQHKEDIKHLRKLLKNKKLTEKQKEQYLKKIDSIKVKIEKQNNKDKINKCKEHIKNLQKTLKNNKITEKQKQQCQHKISNYKLKIQELVLIKK
jgi:hypothetical protein